MTFFKMVLISFLYFRPIMQFAGWQRTGCSLSSLTVTCEDDRDLAYNFKASVIFIQDFVYEKLFKLLVLDLVIQEIMQVLRHCIFATQMKMCTTYFAWGIQQQRFHNISRQPLGFWLHRHVSWWMIRLSGTVAPHLQSSAAHSQCS